MTHTLPPPSLEPEAPALTASERLAAQYRARPDVCRRIVAELTRRIEAREAAERTPR